MSWLAIALLGGLVGLDSAAFPQIMISRPIVAAAIAGLVFGDPVAGIQIGVALEAFSLVALPVGAARYPEGGTAAVSVATAYVAAGGGAVPLLIALGFGAVWEHVMGQSMLAARWVNGRLVSEEAIAAGARIESRHLAAMGFDFMRAAVLTVVGAWIALALVRGLAPLWGAPTDLALGMVTVAGVAMLAAMLPIFGGWSEKRVAFGAGLGAGILLWALA